PGLRRGGAINPQWAIPPRLRSGQALALPAKDGIHENRVIGKSDDHPNARKSRAFEAPNGVRSIISPRQAGASDARSVNIRRRDRRRGSNGTRTWRVVGRVDGRAISAITAIPSQDLPPTSSP